jgi:uncharacterized protein with GYD domain
MATYIVLFNWTDQGIKSFEDSPSRVDSASKELEKDDIRIKSIFWTIGPHDLVAIIKAPNDEKLTRALLKLGAQGNVRTTTMRAFDREEFAELI